LMRDMLHPQLPKSDSQTGRNRGWTKAIWRRADPIS
jgi:hypothetical protein